MIILNGPFLIISRNTSRYTYVLDNVKISFSAWVLRCRGLVEEELTLTRNSKKPLKKLQSWLKDPTIEIWAEDEVHFQQVTSLIRTWTLVGKQPQIISPPTREKVGFFGAVSLKTGQLVTQTISPFNAKTFKDFLYYLLSLTHRSILLVLDNASYHRATELKSFFMKHRVYIKLLFLPPYLPELNSIKRVWRITHRRVTYSRYFLNIEVLKEALINQFAQWEYPNETLRILCANI